LAPASIGAVFTLASYGGDIAATGDVRPGAAHGEAVAVVAADNEFEPGVLELAPAPGDYRSGQPGCTSTQPGQTTST
jgi:hypothetical protein